MNHVKKLNQYFNELARTYHLFFKSAPLIATCVLLLAPLQAVVPLIAVAAGQKVIDQVTNHSPFMEMIIVWIVATAFQQFLPSLSTMVQGILTDKLTGFINISLMKKSEALKTSAKNNTEADFEFAYFDYVDDALIDGLEQNQDFFTLLLQNDEIKRQVLGLFVGDTY